MKCDICEREISITSFVCDECARELRNKPDKSRSYRSELRSRIDVAAYPVFLFLFAGTCYLIADAHGWLIALFVMVLETTILELGYRLTQK